MASNIKAIIQSCWWLVVGAVRSEITERNERAASLEHSNMMSMQSEAAATLPPPPQPSASSKRRKKRKKSVSALLNNSSDDGDGTILQSKLSLKKQLSLKNTCKQTPWYDTNELIDTGSALLLALKLFPTHHQQHHEHTTAPEGLTPDEHNQLQLAFRRVAVWRGHSARGRLSHAVDITAGLAGLLLSDAERTFHSNATGNNPYQLRNSYSTLLLRSVNGLADTYRHQRKSSLLSVSHCCALAGLPLWIVDIRHDASHNDLPSLGLCRIGAIESLRFWKTRYWDTLENKVWGKKSEIGTLASPAESDDVGICSYALDCLVRYQQAALLEAKEKKTSKRNQEAKAKQITKQQMKEEHASDKADTETEDLLLLPDEPKRVATREKSDGKTAGSNNPFAIFDNDKPKKKKSKKNPEQKSDQGVATIETEPALSNSDDTKKATAKNLQVSSRDCAAEFVREIPMDIAISEVLKFLVWGIGQDDSKIHQGPAIITGQAALSATHDVVDDTFNNLRAIYDPLIIAITNAYPGFVATLVVHLIDSILCQDSERGSQGERSNSFENHVKDESELYLQQITCNIQYMSMWIHYIFSREFHMHFDRSTAIYVEEAKSVLVTSSQTGEKREFQSHPIDLKKKGRKNWTQQQLKFMQSHLQYTTFQSLGIPMNSICDRLLSHGEKYLCDSGGVVYRLLHLFEGILKENRVAFMGLLEKKGTDDDNTNANDVVCVAADKVELETVTPCADKSAAAGASTDATSASRDMSLEDMEAFLSSAANPGDKCAEEGFNDLDNIQAKTQTPTSRGVDVPEIKPWTLCKSWDSCAIGSMPGYPA